MPPLPLTALLQSALPHVSGLGRAVVSALACFNGQAGSAQRLAALCGMTSRYQLARALRRNGLPQLDHLVAGTRVLRWLLEAERTGESLLQLARRDHVSPAVAYRLVHRTTTLRWSQARRAGLTAMVRRLADAWAYQGNGRGSSEAAWARPRSTFPRQVAQGRFLGGDTEPACPADRRGLPAEGARHPRGVLAARLPTPDYPFDVVVAPNGVA